MTNLTPQASRYGASDGSCRMSRSRIEQGSRNRIGNYKADCTKPKARVNSVSVFFEVRIMKLVVLVLMAALPSALAAQVQAPVPLVVASSAQADTPPGRNFESSTEPETGIGIGPALAMSPQQQPSAKPPKSPKPKLSIPGSMVGYIDSAIVASQVRIRFEAAFHD